MLEAGKETDYRTGVYVNHRKKDDEKNSSISCIGKMENRRWSRVPESAGSSASVSS